MAKSNLSAVLRCKDDLRLENRPVPEPGKNEVLVAIHSVGICGSDVHYWKRGRIGDFVVKKPMVLGHETSGIVEKVGDCVKHLKPGDRVCIEPGVPCRVCEFCKKGRYNICPDVKFCATPPGDGSLCQYYCHAADFCYKLSENVTLEEGSLMEPLSIAVHACRRAGVTAGNSVLVCGAGPIGLVNLLVSKAMGASKICITEVLIAIHSVGVCGSDIHFWKAGGIGDTLINEPMVLGHEGSGIVVKVGSSVKSLKSGDRVCIEPAIPCRACDFCKGGRYNLCPYVKGCSTPKFDGCLCQYYCFPADLCFKLPDNISLEEGALIEPLSVSVHTCRRAGVTAGSSVVICGAGAIGLLNMMVCKAMGASRICITDIDANRLETARKLGATYQINVKDKSTEQLIQEIKTKLGNSPDITLECSGAPSSIKMGILVTKSGGVYVQVGVGAATVKIPIIDATVREIDIRGVFRYANCFPIALDLVATGAVDVKPLISHRFKLLETQKAYETSASHSEGAVKVLINCEKP